MNKLLTPQELEQLLRARYNNIRLHKSDKFIKNDEEWDNIVEVNTPMYNKKVVVLGEDHLVEITACRQSSVGQCGVLFGNDSYYIVVKKRVTRETRYYTYNPYCTILKSREYYNINNICDLLEQYDLYRELPLIKKCVR